KSLVNIADREGGIHFAKDPEAGAEMVPQVQPSVRPGAKEVVARPQLGQATNYLRVEEHRRQAYTRQPAEIKVGTALVMPAHIVEINDLHVEPAPEGTVAHRVEVGDDRIPLRGEEAIR